MHLRFVTAICNAVERERQRFAKLMKFAKRHQDPRFDLGSRIAERGSCTFCAPMILFHRSKNTGIADNTLPQERVKRNFRHPTFDARDVARPSGIYVHGSIATIALIDLDINSL